MLINSFKNHLIIITNVFQMSFAFDFHLAMQHWNHSAANLLYYFVRKALWYLYLM